ncbi:hypothetical protein MMC21_007464 [Puttea exsequens]|nr:hypothetical protein [Puttea exsequens]
MTTSGMTQRIHALENIIGHRFNDPTILWEALQAAGSGLQSVGTRHFADGNKRLALLGDAVLKLALIDDWYGGVGSRRRNAAASFCFQDVDTHVEQADAILQSIPVNANLDKVARHRGLDAFVCRNSSQVSSVPTAVMTVTMEAIIGAVWLDTYDLSTLRGVINTLGLVPT